MTDPDRCSICGHTEPRDLTTSLAHWRDAPKGMAYSHETRCSDVRACKRRVELAGKPWPLVEAASDRRTA
jgi:hypothetical protein